MIEVNSVSNTALVSPRLRRERGRGRPGTSNPTIATETTARETLSTGRGSEADQATGLLMAGDRS